MQLVPIVCQPRHRQIVEVVYVKQWPATCACLGVLFQGITLMSAGFCHGQPGKQGQGACQQRRQREPDAGSEPSDPAAQGRTHASAQPCPFRAFGPDTSSWLDGCGKWPCKCRGFGLTWQLWGALQSELMGTCRSRLHLIHLLGSTKGRAAWQKALPCPAGLGLWLCLVAAFLLCLPRHYRTFLRTPGRHRPGNGAPSISRSV